MPQTLLGITKSRDVFPAIAGPPKPPMAFRVSAIRHGVIGANCVAAAAAEPANKDNSTSSSLTDNQILRLPFLHYSIQPRGCLAPPAWKSIGGPIAMYDSHNASIHTYVRCVISGG